MHSNLALAATMVVIFTAGLVVGVIWSDEECKTFAVKQGYFAHNGQLYQVTGIRPRGE